MSHPTLPVPLHVLADQQAVLEAHPPATIPQASPVPNPTISFWQKDLDIYPEAAHGSDGPLTTDADICIIGSGISGVSAAYHLAKTFAQEGSSRPITAVILEARDFCSGATGRNGGHLSYALHEEFAAKQFLYGVDEALREIKLQQYTVDELLKLVRAEKQEAELDLVSGGRVGLFFTEEEYVAAKADYEAAKKAGVDLRFVEWLSKEEVHEQYGASYPGIRAPGNNIWPLKTVGLLFKLAQEASSNFSLALHTRTPVTAITPGGSTRQWKVETPRGNISCSFVVHATNAYASHLLRHLRGPDGIIPTRGQIVALRAAAPADVITKSAWGGNEGFEYWFPRPVKGHEAKPLVILGGGREAAKPQYELYQVDDSALNPTVSAALRKFLPAVFPGKYEPGREPEAEWSGIMGFTKSGDPFVGPVIDPSDEGKYKGQFLSAGFSGHGMPRAFACAEVIAGMIVSEMTGKPWSIPEWLPAHYLTKK